MRRRSDRSFKQHSLIKRLKRALAQALPEDKVLDGLSIKEKGRSFSIRLEKNGDVVAAGVKLVPPRSEKSRAQTCDALFVLRDLKQSHAIIIFVELKGTDVDHAIGQIESSFYRLCKNKNSKEHDSIFNKLPTTPDLSHEGRAFGIVVSSRGLTQAQIARKRLRPDLNIKFRKSLDSLRISEVYDWIRARGKP